jgi:hypothetical protein
MSTSDQELARDVSTPLGEAREGRLEFFRGASLITLSTERSMDDLFRAHFDGPIPHVQTHDGKVSIHYRRISLFDWARFALLWSHHAATITLNAAIPWQLVVHGGLTKLDADLRGGLFSGLKVHDGVSDIEVQLPPPKGIVPIRIRGGASNVELRYPAGTAVSLRIRGGASQLTFDTQHIGSQGGPVRLTTQRYDVQADGYDIEVQGGASALIIDPQ